MAQNRSSKSIYASQESFYKFLDGITMVFSAAHLNLNQNYLCGGVVYAPHKMCGSAPHWERQQHFIRFLCPYMQEMEVSSSYRHWPHCWNLACTLTSPLLHEWTDDTAQSIAAVILFLSMLSEVIASGDSSHLFLLFFSQSCIVYLIILGGFFLSLPFMPNLTVDTTCMLHVFSQNVSLLSQ